MGVVDLDCIASNPNSTILYGIGNGEDSGGEVITTIYRSNINPANATDIKWEQRRSAFSRNSDTPGAQPHFKYSRFGGVDCAVSTSGEFTAFFYNPVFAVTGSARPVPMGIRLHNNWMQPTLEIYGSTMYGWTNQNFVHQSFYIEKDGVESVVHAVMDETASVIRFGLVDKDTGYLQLAAIWKLVDGRFMVGELTDKIPKLPNPMSTTFAIQYSPAPTINTDQRHMVYQNGSLYLYSDTTGLISSFPFSSPLTTPTQKDFFQATPIPTSRRNMFFQGMRQNSSYLGYLARVDSLIDIEDDSLNINMTMQLSTIEVSFDLTVSPTTKSTTRNATMDRYGIYKDVAYLQTMGGQLPGQVPFAVGLTAEGYYGITLDGTSMGSMVPFEDRSSIIEGVEDRYTRSRFRNHDQQVVPGYKEPIELSAGEIFGVVMGVIFGFLILLYPIGKFSKWLEKIRLDDERRAVESESFELIARLRHANAQPSSDPSSTTTAVGGGGRMERLPFDSSSANTTSHTLLNDLGLTRHPRPNTVITIGDGVDESV
ncbi:hypothetical protein KI688_009091 [Linnemannia hyalina]|uniref:Uncharacterized protein n=1 Tax=Linnemannia hyalina TaxID=64524 RepID=A0A9P7Y1U8_9FUNG|nr:hypothetical protein KI688_009091 [Linnemannia hyalina]